MREPPEALRQLRAEVRRSMGWRQGNKTISLKAHAALPEKGRGKWRWLPDPRLVERLNSMEREWTGTFPTR